MKQLNYKVLEESGYDGYVLKEGKEKILQFGEGNFLRAFVDDFFDLANERVGYNRKASTPSIFAAAKTAERWMKSG